MNQKSPKIDLTNLASAQGTLISSMARELEGRDGEAVASDRRWPARFISAGPKHAPAREVSASRWGTRFLAAGPKKAPHRD